MPGIVPQSEYYGLPEREAASLPPSHVVADILRPTGIPSGTMNTRKHAGHDFHNMEIDDIQDLADSGHPGARSHLERFYEKPEGYFTDENYSGPGLPDRANNPHHSKRHASQECEYCGKPGHGWETHPEAHRDVADYQRERQREEFPFGDHQEGAYPSEDDHDGSYWPGKRAGIGHGDGMRGLYGPGRDFGRDGGPANPPEFYEEGLEPSDEQLDEDSLHDHFERERDPHRYHASYADDIYQRGLEDPNTRSRFEDGHHGRPSGGVELTPESHPIHLPKE